MSSAEDPRRDPHTPPAAPGDGVPDDVETAEGAGGVRGGRTPPAHHDGVPDDLDPDAAAVARAVADEDDRVHADADGAPDDDDAVLEGEVLDAEVAEDGVDADARDDDEEAEPEPDWRDQYLRTAAELDNVRKRARRDVAAGETRGVGRMARELLPAFDDLDRAVQHLEDHPETPEHEHLATAVRTVHASLQRALEKVGIDVDRPEGEPFDPHRHEALTQQPAPEGVEPGTIVAVYQAGYRRGEDVLRAAKVVVAG